MPRPTRVRSLLAPSFGFRSLKLIGIVCLIFSRRADHSLLGWALRFAVDNDQVSYFDEHAAVRWRIRDLDSLVDPPQTKCRDGGALVRWPADHAANQGDLQHLWIIGLFLCH